MKTNKLIAVATAAVLAVLPAPAGAETVKNEILYATYDADGTNADYVVVNRFDVDQAQTLTDYGTYDTVTNLTSDAPITVNGDELTVQADEGAFYYEGTLAQAELPWILSLSFLYNGEPITAKELAGKRGTVDITLSVKQNPRCDKDYFDHYALSISTSFDTANCSNFHTNGILANVGKSKQVSFTVIPGNEEDLTISMYASRFAMDAFAINGVPLSMDTGAIDTEDAKSDLSDLESGAADLDDGANQLADGVSELEDGADELFTGSGQVSAAMRTLSSAAGTLSDGNDQVVDGIAQLADGVAELSGFNQKIKDGAAKITDADTQQKIAEAEAKLTAGATLLNDGVDRLSTGVSGLATKIDGMGQKLIGAATYLSSIKSVVLNGNGSIAGVTSAITTLEDVIGDIETAAGAIVDNTPGQSVKGSLTSAKTKLQSVLATLNLVQGALTTATNGVTYDAVVAELQATGESLIAPNGSFYQQAATLEGSVNDAKQGLKVSVQAYTSGVLEYVASMQQLNGGAKQLATGIEDYLLGEKKLANGIAALQSQYGAMSSGISAFTGGVKKLANNYSTLDLGVQQLVDGIDELADGVTELTDGTFELRDRTSGASNRVDEEVDKALDKFHNDDYVAASFTSDKNTPAQVQFVIKYRAVELPEETEQPADEDETEKSPLERLMDLFR